MNADRNHELVELLLGELEPEREAYWRAQLAKDAALRAELSELEALFGFMRRGEEIDVDPAVHSAVMAEARRLTRPSLVERLGALPALFRFRLRHSRGFRIAAVSLGVHLVVMLVLYQVVVRGRAEDPDVRIHVQKPDPGDAVLDIRPSEAFVFQLRRARVSRSARLQQWGVEGQREAIRAGLERLLAKQQVDGSFGDLAATGRAALVLLAEGATSSDDSRRGRSLRRAMVVLRQRAAGAPADSAAADTALTALIEDWALGFDQLTTGERDAYVRVIGDLAQRCTGVNGRYWAAQAGFPVSGPVVEPDGPAIVIRNQHESRDPAARERWAPRFRKRFQDALAPAREGDAQALLELQSPYRF